MRYLITLLLLLLPVWTVPAQSPARPLTRDEIIDQLRQIQANPRQSGQGDLAESVVERGVAFEVDDAVLDLFRQAGARSFLLDAIRRAGTKPAAPTTAERPRLRSAEVPVSPPSETLVATSEEPTPEERAAALARLPFIEQARYHALEYTGELPNFRVTQLVTRYARGPASKDWEKRDTLELELSYSDRDGEKYRLVKLNGAPTRMSYDQLGGSTSTGEFGALMGSIFSARAKTEFRESGRENFNGRATILYDFLVKKANSNSELSDRTTGRTVIAGYRGTVWIDLETKRVLRVELAHENMPPGFPISVAENAVEYDWVTIGGERHLLPVRAEMILGRESERQYSRNLIEFRQYQKFDSDVRLVPDSN
jgi:hypothetical protein